MGFVVPFALPLYALMALAVIAHLIYAQKDARSDVESWLALSLGILLFIICGAFAFYSDNINASLLRAFFLSSIPILIIATSIKLKGAVLIKGVDLIRMVLYSGVLTSIYYLSVMVNEIFINGNYAAIYERYSGGALELPWGASNVVASVLLLPFFISTSSLSRNNNSRLKLVAPILLGCGILSTMSRTSVIIMIIWIIFTIARNGDYLKKLSYLGAACVVLWSGLNATGLKDSKDFDIMISNRVDFQSNAEIGGRKLLWLETISNINATHSQPIGYYQSIAEFGYTSHNFILSMMIETGVLGTAAGLFLFGFTVVTSFVRSMKDEGGEIIIRCFAFTLLLVLMMFEDSIYTMQFSLMVASSISLIFGLKK